MLDGPGSVKARPGTPPGKPELVNVASFVAARYEPLCNWVLRLSEVRHHRSHSLHLPIL